MRELKFNLLQIFFKTLFLAGIVIVVYFAYDILKDRKLEKKYEKEVCKDYPVSIPRGEIKRDTVVFNLKKHSDFADSLINANK